jgi:formylglycine-generating enzyme required for sulfatase activity
MMRNRTRPSWLPLAVAFLLIAPAASAVTIEWVTVGDPGNACDVQPQGCFGAVADTYLIGKYEVTNAQYAEFLNAKATSIPNVGLWNTNMPDPTYGGITQSGSPGSYTYSTVAGRENKPVVYVSFYSALRFANWLHNGQGSGDTETGAYTLLGGTITPSNWWSITRNASANIFLTSEDEWYKAAYYDAISTSYNPYPFADGFNGVACESPAGTTTHSANCGNVVGNTTDVGAYTTSPSANGTFDQGGNVTEWNESQGLGGLSYERGLRGGSWSSIPVEPDYLAASGRGAVNGSAVGAGLGFRVAAVVPEPSAALLFATGFATLAAVRRRKDGSRSAAAYYYVISSCKRR